MQSSYYERSEISHSDLMLIDKSIEHYLRKGKFDSTDAMDLGRAFHCYILEREKFDNEFVVKPENMKFTTKDGKEWQANNLDRTVIDFKDFRWFELMQKKIIEHPMNYVLQGNSIEVEKEIFFEYQDLQCRSKLDYINPTKRIIIDFKTISDCSKAESESKWKYSSQAYFYQIACYEEYGELFDCIFIFAEKSYPHGVKYIKFTPDTLTIGANKIQSAIDKYKNYLSNPEQYTGYSENLIEV